MPRRSQQMGCDGPPHRIRARLNGGYVVTIYPEPPKPYAVQRQERNAAILRILVRFAPMTVAEVLLRAGIHRNTLRRHVECDPELTLWDGRLHYAPDGFDRSYASDSRPQDQERDRNRLRRRRGSTYIGPVIPPAERSTFRKRHPDLTVAHEEHD